MKDLTETSWGMEGYIVKRQRPKSENELNIQTDVLKEFNLIWLTFIKEHKLWYIGFVI